MDRCRLSPTVRAAVERELRALPALKARLASLEAEMAAVPAVRAAGVPQVRHEPRAGDPVAKVAEERERLRQQADELRLRIRQVELALEALPQEQRMVIEGYYIQGKPRVEIEAELSISTKTFWRLRSRGLEVVAYVLFGVMPEEAAG